ncbi:MAG: acetoacetate--CoA ligase [Saprospiraceae bacterium]
MKPELLWKPSIGFAENSRLNHFLNWLSQNKNLKFDNYSELWDWSVNEIEDFWLSVVDYFEVDYSGEIEKVLSGTKMPDFKWFQGIKLSYSEHIFKNKNERNPAIISYDEFGNYRELSWSELEEKVASFAYYLKSVGVGYGDRVAAYLPNVPEATIAFLAVNSLGAIWSSASPDFGVDSIVDRFAQIEPKVFISVDGYSYNGKSYDKINSVNEIVDKISSIEKLVLFRFLRSNEENKIAFEYDDFDQCTSLSGHKLEFTRVEFNHPIWILFSSGTTGLPKAITHGTGGMLLEHLKYLTFHNDVKPGERFFWFSTTGWMMWNFVQASMLAGATIVLYEGSPGYPNLNSLWQFSEKSGINHFGISAPFIVACMKAGLKPKSEFDLSNLRSVSSTGAPLPPEGFKWVYENVKSDIWLVSMSGGTDVCTAFVGGNPMMDVHKGEIQCRALGASVYAYDDAGNKIYDAVGEMVITKPMPCMPVFFWNDEDNARYISSYFEYYNGIWKHGDWIKINSETRGLTILGRSDATLNRQGVRIGTAEIYRAVDMIDEIKDSLIVNLELANGDHFMPLFVVLKPENILDDNLKIKIKNTLRSEYSPRHVPDEIIEVDDLPYTISGKKMEAPVKKILLGMDISKVLNKDSIKNPQSIDFFINFANSLESLR